MTVPPVHIESVLEWQSNLKSKATIGAMKAAIGVYCMWLTTCDAGALVDLIISRAITKHKFIGGAGFAHAAPHQIALNTTTFYSRSRFHVFDGAQIFV